MSGLEIFMDGGVTVSAIASAVAVRLGFTEHKRDEKQLATPEDIQCFRTSLAEAHAALDSAHRALTTEWGSPLSLFDDGAMREALERGVPGWAVASVQRAQDLVHEAAELGDRADVYEAQLRLADDNGAGLLREPVNKLLEQLADLTQRLSLHSPLLRRAHDEFASPSECSDAGQLASTSHGAVGDQDSTSQRVAKAAPMPETPMRILQQRGRFGAVYSTLREAGLTAATALQLPQVDSNKTEKVQEVEYSSYVYDYIVPPRQGCVACAS